MAANDVRDIVHTESAAEIVLGAAPHCRCSAVIECQCGPSSHEAATVVYNNNTPAAREQVKHCTALEERLYVQLEVAAFVLVLRQFRVSALVVTNTEAQEQAVNMYHVLF